MLEEEGDVVNDKVDKHIEQEVERSQRRHELFTVLVPSQQTPSSRNPKARNHTLLDGAKSSSLINLPLRRQTQTFTKNKLTLKQPGMGKMNCCI